MKSEGAELVHVHPGQTPSSVEGALQAKVKVFCTFKLA
jgi:hypothetical protein